MRKQNLYNSRKDGTQTTFPVCPSARKGEFQICPLMDFNNILYVEYLRYNNYKNEIISFLEGC